MLILKSVVSMDSRTSWESVKFFLGSNKSILQKNSLKAVKALVFFLALFSQLGTVIISVRLEDDTLKHFFRLYLLLESYIV